MNDTPEVTQPFTTTLRHSISACLELFEESQGVGKDPYWSHPIYHPMAEAEYIATLHKLREADLLSPAKYGKKLKASVPRLEHSALSAGGGVAWGLGFPHREAPGDEPYVITTALIVRSLKGTVELGVAGADALFRGATLWLDEQVPTTRTEAAGTQVAVPQFSPHTPALVVNAAAMWAAALAETGLPVKSDVDAVIEWVFQRYEPGVGWTYIADDSRVDLVHQCYILSALGAVRGFSALEQMALECLAPFWQGGLIDKFDVLDLEDGIARVAGASTLSLHPRGDDGLVLHPDRARPWGVGALLGVCAELEREGRYPDYWRALARRCAQRELASFDAERLADRWGLRQLMHLAHGLAGFLGNLRLRPAEAAVAGPQPNEEAGDVI